jgi:hypothetical protein
MLPYLNGSSFFGMASPFRIHEAQRGVKNEGEGKTTPSHQIPSEIFDRGGFFF